ncbi:hypothetical protein B5566_02485 [Mycobacterium sp. MHSD3]|nr:hypothetical protein B5566_02485 [Mycobacterium sp. MHSD3]
MTQPQPPSLDRYAATVAEVRNRLVTYGMMLWGTVGFTDEGMERLVSQIVPKVISGQLLIANLTAAYFARVTGTDVMPVDEELVTGGRGVDPEIVYQRPTITTRSKIAKGAAVALALKFGARRLRSLLATDLQMAKVRQADVSLAGAGIDRFRRVPQGEHTCARCLIASTQLYYVGNLMPIHPGCDCSVDTVPASFDLDAWREDMNVRLEATHDLVGEFTGDSDRSGRAVNYLDLIVTHDHGEIGPVIAWRDQKFTRKSEISGLTVSELPVVDLDALV